jgi:hypothetical protein
MAREGKCRVNHFSTTYANENEVVPFDWEGPKEEIVDGEDV